MLSICIGSSGSLGDHGYDNAISSMAKLWCPVVWRRSRLEAYGVTPATLGVGQRRHGCYRLRCTPPRPGEPSRLWGSQTCGWLIRGRSARQAEQADARLKMIELGWPNDARRTGSSSQCCICRTRGRSIFARITTCCVSQFAEHTLKLVRTYWRQLTSKANPG